MQPSYSRRGTAEHLGALEHVVPRPAEELSIDPCLAATCPTKTQATLLARAAAGPAGLVCFSGLVRSAACCSPSVAASTHIQDLTTQLKPSDNWTPLTCLI